MTWCLFCVMSEFEIFFNNCTSCSFISTDRWLRFRTVKCLKNYHVRIIRKKQNHGSMNKQTNEKSLAYKTGGSHFPSPFWNAHFFAFAPFFNLILAHVLITHGSLLAILKAGRTVLVNREHPEDEKFYLGCWTLNLFVSCYCLFFISCCIMYWRVFKLFVQLKPIAC